MAPVFRLSDGRFAAGDGVPARSLRALPGGLLEALAAEPGGPLPRAPLAAPVDRQEVWAAGVTYERSRDARMEESADAPDLYARVYAAERPELFFKAPAWRVRGPAEPVCVRADSEWNVPEPELALLYGPAGRLLAATIGDDVSSRSIEGENPLYLPQAKVYDGSCALGPAWVPPEELPPLDALRIELRIERAGEEIFSGETHTSLLRRSPRELGDWLGRALPFPDGVVLLTGTSIVPPAELSLRAGDAVTVAIEGLGELRNPVELARGWGHH